MNCGDFRYLVQRRFDTELSPADDRALLIHLETCESCQRFYHQVQQVIIAAEELELAEDILPRNPQQLASTILENIPAEKQGIMALFTSFLARFGLGLNNNGDSKRGLLPGMEVTERKRLPPPVNLAPVASTGPGNKFNGQGEHPLMNWGQSGELSPPSPVSDERSEKAAIQIKVPDEQVSTRSLGEKFGISGATNILNSNQPLSLAESIRQKIAEMSKTGGDYSSAISVDSSPDPAVPEPLDEWSIPHSPQWPKLDPNASPEEWKSEASGPKAPNTWGNPVAGWGQQTDPLPVKSAVAPVTNHNISNVEINVNAEISKPEKSVANDQKNEQLETPLGWSIEAEQMETGTWQTVQFDTTLGATGHVSPPPSLLPSFPTPASSLPFPSFPDTASSSPPSSLPTSPSTQSLPKAKEAIIYPDNLMASPNQQPLSQHAPLSAVVESMSHSTPNAILPEAGESRSQTESGSELHSTTQSIAAIDDSEFVLPEVRDAIISNDPNKRMAGISKENGAESEKSDVQSFVPSSGNPKIYPVVSRRARTAFPFSKSDVSAPPSCLEGSGSAEASAAIPSVAAAVSPAAASVPLVLIPESIPTNSSKADSIPTSTHPAAYAPPPAVKPSNTAPTGGIDSLLKSLAAESNQSPGSAKEILNKQETSDKPEAKSEADAARLFSFDDGAIDKIFSNNLGIHERSKSAQLSAPPAKPQSADITEQAISSSEASPSHTCSADPLPNDQNTLAQALPPVSPSSPDPLNLNPSIPVPSIRTVSSSGSSIPASYSAIPPPRFVSSSGSSMPDSSNAVSPTQSISSAGSSIPDSYKTVSPTQSVPSAGASIQGSRGPVNANPVGEAPSNAQAQTNHLFAVDDNMIDHIFSDRLGVPDQGNKNVVSPTTGKQSQLSENLEISALPAEPGKISTSDFIPPSTPAPEKLSELISAAPVKEDSPQFGGSNKHSPSKQKISGVGRLDSRAGAAIDPGSGRISSIGKFLLDSKDLEKIGRLTSADLSDGKMRTLTLEANEELKNLLKQIDAQPGVLGTVIVGHDGLLIAHTMSQDGDAESLGVEALAIYMGTLQVVEKLGDNNVRQIVSCTNQGYLIVANFGAGLLVTLTNPLMLAGLLPLMRTITQLVAA